MRFRNRDTEGILGAPISGWRIDTTLTNGSVFTLSGSVYSGDGDEAELLRLVDGIASGLLAAGFEPSVILKRTMETVR